MDVLQVLKRNLLPLSSWYF